MVHHRSAVWSSPIGTSGCLAPFLGAMARERYIGIAGRTIMEANFSGARNRGCGLSLFTGATAPCQQEHQGDEPVDVGYVCGAAILLRVAMIGKSARSMRTFEPTATKTLSSVIA
jgi:hypothetical protein